MLRYLERVELVVPSRSSSGYRAYGPRELNQLRALDLVRRRFQLGLDEIAFALRLRREPDLRRALDAWLAGTDPWTPLPIASPAAWVEWEQEKHQRLLAA
jgi:DNA-binding transcriptional MerR regulator